MAARKTQRLPELDGLRGVALVLVVAIHAFAYTGLDANEHVGLHFFIAAIAVPVFFFVDGLLLGLRAPTGPGYATQLKQSARRLLWPWLIFGTGYIALRGMLEWFGLVDEQLVLGAGFSEWRDDFLYSRIATQMYFLPALFVLRALSPIWLSIARLNPAAPLMLAVLTSLTLRAGGVQALYAEAFGQSGYDIGVHALWGLEFHLYGFAVAPWIETLRKLGRAQIAAGIVLGLATAAFTYRSGGFVPQYGLLVAVTLPFVAMGLRSRIFEALGQESMGIYLLHTPILLSALHRLIGLAVPDGIPHFLILTAACVLLTQGVTLSLGYIPGARSFLFGEPARSGQKPRRDGDQPIK